MKTAEEVRQALKGMKLAVIAERTGEKHDKLWRFRENRMAIPDYDFVMKVREAIEQNH